MSEHYVLEGKEAKSVDLITWAKWFEAADRHVAKTDITDDIHVSTVFLGLDHSFGDGPPLLYETMIFGGEHDEYQQRYSTWEQAEAGHEKAVELARV
jgi:hypothetical protein